MFCGIKFQVLQDHLFTLPPLGALRNLERIEGFDCVFGVYYLLLYWMKSVGCLNGLNGGGWGVFIAPTTILVVGWLFCRWAHRTLYCSLSGEWHVSWPLGFGAVDRWSHLSSYCIGQSGGTPDSPVRPIVADCLLTSDASNYGHSRAVDRWAKQTIGRCLTGQSGGSPDSPVNFSARTCNTHFVRKV
jgi:hypothetical protein